MNTEFPTLQSILRVLVCEFERLRPETAPCAPLGASAPGTLREVSRACGYSPRNPRFRRMARPPRSHHEFSKAA
jgi:hypothetical protein